MKYFYCALLLAASLVLPAVSSAQTTTVADGFYHAGSRYYFVSHNQRLRLRTPSQYWTTLVSVLQANHAALTGISEQDFGLLNTTNTEGQHLQTSSNASLFHRLDGRIIIRAHSHGELYYVSGSMLYNLSVKNIATIVHDTAMTVHPKIITPLSRLPRQ
jgi:hypothetical protein